MTLFLIRVRYGSKNTPKEKREYQQLVEGKGKGPVGCLSEWRETFPDESFSVTDGDEHFEVKP